MDNSLVDLYIFSSSPSYKESVPLRVVAPETSAHPLEYQCAINLILTILTSETNFAFDTGNGRVGFFVWPLLPSLYLSP